MPEYSISISTLPTSLPTPQTWMLSIHKTRSYLRRICLRQSKFRRSYALRFVPFNKQIYTYFVCVDWFLRIILLVCLVLVWLYRELINLNVWLNKECYRDTRKSIYRLLCGRVRNLRRSTETNGIIIDFLEATHLLII